MQQDINIFYSINDKTKKTNYFSLDELKTYINYDTIITSDINNDLEINQNEEEDNNYEHYYEKYNYYKHYTTKSLIYILDFYKIKHKRLKDDIIQDIVLFESDIKNKEIVDERIRLWKNIKELSDHHYFKKYIIFDI